MAQKLQAGKFPLVTPGNPPLLDSHRVLEREGQRCHQNLMRAHLDAEASRACLEKVKRHLGVRIEGVNYKQGGPRILESFFRPEESKSKILRGYCGVIEPVIYNHLLYWA